MKSIINYILENIENKDGFVIKRNKETTEEFFIQFSKERFAGNSVYIPSYSSIRSNNFRRIKIFKTKEDALKYIDQYLSKNENNDYWDEVKNKMEVISYSDALELIGDNDTKHKELKSKQNTDRKQRQKERYEHNKENNKKKEIEYSKNDPGKYYVRFPYTDNEFDGMEFTIQASSINDAFEKGKVKALKQDPNCNTPGYDHKIKFTKKYIRKESNK